MRNYGRVASVEELRVNSRLFVWAYHSDCQESLFGSVIPNEPSWQEMRALGIGFWFANVPQLRARVIHGPLLFSILLTVLSGETNINLDIKFLQEAWKIEFFSGQCYEIISRKGIEKKIWFNFTSSRNH